MIRWFAQERKGSLPLSLGKCYFFFVAERIQGAPVIAGAIFAFGSMAIFLICGVRVSSFIAATRAIAIRIRRA